MKSFMHIILLVTFLITTWNCAKDTAQPAPVDFQFRLLNNKEMPSTTFNQGENFVFSFIIINRSNEDLYLKQSSLNLTEFLKVYQTNSNEGIPILLIGKPYESLFCTYKNGILIPANDTLKLEIPWMPSKDGCCTHFCLVENNALLPNVKYRTGFSSSFEFFRGDEFYKTDVNSFNINFEVK